MSLQISNLSKSYGRVRALNDVSLAVNPGEVLGIMGVNGAGKSTLLNCICGFATPDAGAIELGGRGICGQRPDHVSRAGVGRTFQVPRSFRSLTVLENLLVVPARGEPSGILFDRAHHALEKVKLATLANNYAGELSGGQQKLLELARILILEPQVVLFDEPLAGMHSDLCRVFLDEVAEMLSLSVAVMLVCHDPGILYRLARDIVVLHEGRVLSSGSPAAVRNDPAVIEAYLGVQH